MCAAMLRFPLWGLISGANYANNKIGKRSVVKLPKCMVTMQTTNVFPCLFERKSRSGTLRSKVSAAESSCLRQIKLEMHIRNVLTHNNSLNFSVMKCPLTNLCMSWRRGPLPGARNGMSLCRHCCASHASRRYFLLLH